MRIGLADRITAILISAAKVGTLSVAVDALAKRLRCPVAIIQVQLVPMEIDGLVELWNDARRRAAVCLTPWACGLFDVEASSRRPCRRKSSVVAEADLSNLDTHDGQRVYRLEDIPSDDPPIELHGPDVPGMSTMQRYRFGKADYMAHTIPKPMNLLGSGAPWPLPEVNGHGCPTCGDNPPPTSYCLACHRYPIADALLGNRLNKRRG